MKPARLKQLAPSDAASKGAAIPTDRPVSKSSFSGGDQPVPPGGAGTPAAKRARRAFESISEQVHRDVASGRLKPGDRLPAEREIAVRFGVGRHVVREALRTLEVDGILRSERGVNGGAFIRSGDPTIITRAMRDMTYLGQISTESLTEARILIANDVIRLACERATMEELNAISAQIDLTESLTQAGDFSRRSSEITEFYRLLAQSTHNEVLVMLIESISEIVQILNAKVDLKPHTDLVRVRRQILAHIRSKDADAATREMSDHLNRLSRRIAEQERLCQGKKAR